MVNHLLQLGECGRYPARYWSRLGAGLSKIVDHLFRITVRQTGHEPSENLRAKIAEIVWEHDLLVAPPWMDDFVSLIAHGVSDQTELVLPIGYPHGESGLANILADIESEIGSLGIDDQGEHWTLDIPTLGISIFVSREHPDGVRAVLTPTNIRHG